MSDKGVGGQSEMQNRTHSALSTESNRDVVAYFRESSEGSASLTELAEYVAESGGSKYDSPERAAVKLHHSSLPKLAAAGVVDYDSGSRTVSCCGHSLVTDRMPPVRDVVAVA